MFSERQRLTAAAYIWHYVTGGNPMTVTEGATAWDKWARANVGIARRSRQWMYSTFIPRAVELDIMHIVTEDPKRYALTQR